MAPGYPENMTTATTASYGNSDTLTYTATCPNATVGSAARTMSVYFHGWTQWFYTGWGRQQGEPPAPAAVTAPKPRHPVLSGGNLRQIPRKARAPIMMSGLGWKN